MANLTTHRHSGYIRYEGLYRVPDLLNEEQFIEYMKNTYDVTVKFVHPENKGSSDVDPGQQELDLIMEEVDKQNSGETTPKKTTRRK